MKKLFLSLFIAASCNQQQAVLPFTPSTGTVKYTINDTLNVLFTSQSFVAYKQGCGGLAMKADETIGGRSFSFMLYTDSLQIGVEYSDTLSVSCNKDELTFILNENQKLYSNHGYVTAYAANSTMVITSMDDSLISGTFKCRLITSILDYTDTLNISNGTFTDFNLSKAN